MVGPPGPPSNSFRQGNDCNNLINGGVKLFSTVSGSIFPVESIKPWGLAVF